MSNSVVAEYAVHRTAVALHTGGESAEIGDICNQLIAILLERVGELPLNPPLVYGWAYPTQSPNGVWPNLVAVAGKTTMVVENQCWRRYTHQVGLTLLCGSGNADSAVARAMGLPYLYAIDRVLSHNQSLDGYCRQVLVPEADWGKLDYAGQPWWGWHYPLLIDAQAVWDRR